MRYKIFIPVFILMLLLIPKVYGQTNCAEEEIAAIDEIKRTVENSLINSTNLKTRLESGEEIMAFYFNGKLIKISVFTEPSDVLFFDNGEIKCYVNDGTRNNKIYTDLYYFKNNKVICVMEAASGLVRTITETEEKRLLEKVDKYLTAVQ